MIDPDPASRPSVCAAFQSFAQSILGVSTQYLLFYSHMVCQPQLLMPDLRQLFRLCYLDFLEKEGLFRNIADFSIGIGPEMLFIKSVNFDHFFETIQKIINETSIFNKKLSSQKKDSFKISPAPSTEQSTKDFPHNIDLFSRDQTFFSINEADSCRPQFIGRFSEHLTLLSKQVHQVFKQKYHTLPSFEKVISTLESDKTNTKASQSRSAAPRQSMTYSANYFKNIERLVSEVQSEFQADRSVFQLWPEAFASEPSNGGSVIAPNKSLHDEGLPEYAPRIISQVILNEVLRDLSHCHYREVIAWSLEVCHRLAPLVNSLFLVMTAFPLIQNLYKRPFKISPLKLFRCFVRLGKAVTILPHKTLSSVYALEDYLFVFFDKIIHTSNRLLLSELVGNLGSPNFRFHIEPELPLLHVLGTAQAASFVGQVPQARGDQFLLSDLFAQHQALRRRPDQSAL